MLWRLEKCVKYKIAERQLGAVNGIWELVGSVEDISKDIIAGMIIGLPYRLSLLSEIKPD